MSRLGDYEKYEKNPYVEKAIKEVNGHIAKKYKSATKTDQRAILQAVDPQTGEFIGHTSFIRQIEVDEEKFTKVYLSQFSAFFDLKTQGIKVFGYIMTKLVASQDTFMFLIKDAMKYTGYKTKESIYRGLAQLVEAEIIARTEHDIIYFINPLVAFNGNRITYAKTYVKKTKQPNPNQLDAFESQTEGLQKKLDSQNNNKESSGQVLKVDTSVPETEQQ
jgi:hypothetical protein